MDNLHRLETLEQMRLLSDERRLVILQRLMAAPATLSQLGEAMGKHAAWVRHHLTRLEQVGLVELCATRDIGGFVEKYYRATSRAFSFSALITPALADGGALVVVGSHDLALEILAQMCRDSAETADLWVVPMGSLDGLISLRQGLGQIAACHLLDQETGEYNAPYVTRLFPGERMVLLTLCRREQGLMTAPGNPLGIQRLEDLAEKGARFVNRGRGSGTRLWLDQALRRLGISADRIVGYDDEVATHTEVAARVAEGEADCGLGIKAAAAARGLGFVSLFHERFDLVMRAQRWDAPETKSVAEMIASDAFQERILGLGGYDLSEAGRVQTVE